MTESNHPYLAPALWEIIYAQRRLALHAETTASLHGDATLERDLKHAAYVLNQVLIEERRIWGLTQEEIDMEKVRADKYQDALRHGTVDPEALAAFGG